MLYGAPLELVSSINAEHVRRMNDNRRTRDCLHVAFCLPALARGGMERVTLTLIQGLLDEGFVVDLILEREAGEYLSQIPEGARVFVWQRHSKWRAYAQLTAAWRWQGMNQALRSVLPGLHYLPLRRLPSMVDYFRRESPDIVFASHGRIPILSLLARAVARTRTPVVVVEHSTLSRWLDVFEDQPEKHRRWMYRVRLAQQFYPRADIVAGVSAGVTRDLIETLELNPARTMTLYNPVVSEAALAATYERPPHPWFAPGEPPVVLAVGRLVAEKNFGELISAFGVLHETRSVRLMILGEGEMRPTLQAQIRAAGLEADVALPGWTDCPTRFMAYSAVFALTSWFEGLGIVLVEAMAAGCPVVSFDSPSGPREILEEGRHGALVPLHDIDGLARALADAIDSPRNPTALKARAREFSIENGVAGYRRLIDTLVLSTDD